MSQSSHVVEGEASESDSEIEIGKMPATEVSSSAILIAGEAPESDDETKPNTSKKHDPDTPVHKAFSPPASPMKQAYTSLLHQKLWECNVSLRATLEGLLKHTTDISVEKLNVAERTLLNVQVSMATMWLHHLEESMRSTNANLTLAKARLKQIHAELEKANCSTALPTVKVKT